MTALRMSMLLAIFFDKKDVSTAKIGNIVVSSGVKEHHRQLGNPIYDFVGHLDGL